MVSMRTLSKSGDARPHLLEIHDGFCALYACDDAYTISTVGSRMPLDQILYEEYVFGRVDLGYHNSVQVR